MYLDHWQLTAKPFERPTNRDAFYPSEPHQGAFLKLRYGVENRNGLVVLSGPAGTGKTLLVNLLRQELDDRFEPFIHVVFPQMSSGDLLVYLADHLGGPPPEPARHTTEESIGRIESMLTQNASQERHAVVAIDEAQLLEDCGLLETIRLLSNFQPAGHSVFTILLVGQTGLMSALNRAPAFEQRVGVTTLLRPFAPEETMGYIQHRLRAAGAQTDPFQPDALEAIHFHTQGIPQRIDRLCDLSLLVGFAEGRSQIHADQIEAVTQELVTATAD